MSMFSIIIIVLIAIYCAILLFMYLLFHIPEKRIKANPRIQNLSIIVPHRLDEENLKHYVSQTKQLEAKENCEWIISEDGQDSNLQNETAITYLQNTNKPDQAGKKQAIINGINSANSEFILVHDADVIFSNTKYLERFKEKNITALDLWIGLYQLKPNGKYFLDALQLTENKVLQLLTYGFARIGFPILCSGANLAYHKNMFLSLQPYQNNLKILSGDDLFVLEAFKLNQKSNIGTSRHPDLILQTMAKSEWSAYFSQRIRWVGKSKYLKNDLMHTIGVLSISAHCATLISLVVFCFTQQLPLLYIFIFKVSIEWIIGFTGQLKLEKKFTAAGVLISTFYSIVLIYMLIFGFLKQTTWKDRTL